MKFHLFGYIAVCAVLIGCTDPEKTLEGERLTLDGQPVSELDTDVVNKAARFNPPRAKTNKNWTHHAGSAQHYYGHPALAEQIQNIWSVSIGQGNNPGHKITATPIVINDMIIAMDSRSTVTALRGDGSTVWTADLLSMGDSADDVSGGGLATDGKRIYVTTGFDELRALNISDGSEVWVQKLNSFGGSAPTVYDGLVYVATRDGTAWALSAANGKIEWQLAGPTHMTGFVGGPGPAVTSKWALFPFGTGEILSTFRKGGLRNWTSTVTGTRSGVAISAIQDLTGAPVIVGDQVIVGNASGRTVMLNLETGERIWSANIGVQGTVTVAGASVFAISDLNELVRINRTSGEIIWKIELPFYVDNNPKARKGIFAQYGPVLAGGRLIIASSNGALSSYNPVDGQLIETQSLSSDAATAPVVAGQVLYVVNGDGMLQAFR